MHEEINAAVANKQNFRQKKPEKSVHYAYCTLENYMILL